MFYKLVGVGSVAVFGIVFALSGNVAGPSGEPAQDGRMIAKPVAEVYAAVRNVEESNETSDVSRELNLTRIKVERVANTSLTLRATAGEHKAWNMVVRLAPSPDRTSTYVAVDTTVHPLPGDFKVERGIMGPDMTRLRTYVRLTDALAKLDPTFDKQAALRDWRT